MPVLPSQSIARLQRNSSVAWQCKSWVKRGADNLNYMHLKLMFPILVTVEKHILTEAGKQWFSFRSVVFALFI